MYHITAENMQSNLLSIPIQICDDTNKIVKALALIDSGAGGKFIDQAYAQKLGIKTQKLEQPLIARNVDGMPNKKGKITSFVILNLVINGRTKKNQITCHWIRKAADNTRLSMVNGTNPDINWQTGKFKWRSQTFQVTTRHGLNPVQLAKTLVRKQLGYKKPKSETIVAEEIDEQEYLNHTQNSLPQTELSTLIMTILGDTPSDVWINAKTTTATSIQAEINQQKEDLPLTKQIPREYHQYLDIFD